MMLSSPLSVFLLAVIIVWVMPTHAAAQQHVNGRCNAVIGDGSTSNSIFINCPTGSVRGLFGRFFGRNDKSVLVLNARVSGLKPGRRRLEVAIQNLDEGSSRARIIPGRTTLHDDLGYSYGLACLEMTPMLCVREVFLRAGRTIRLPLVLDQPIHPDAREIYFSIENIWVGASGEAYLNPMGAVEWSVKVPANPDLSTDLAFEETALGLGASTREDIQRALNALGHAAGATDGVFGPKTRSAIAAWQEASGQMPSGYLNATQASELEGIGFRLKVDALRRKSEEAMAQSKKEFEEFQKNAERARRQMDAGALNGGIVLPSEFGARPER